MSRYIDADLIGDRVSNGLVDYEVIKKIPTADVVEVVHGEWIPNESDRHHHCSVCMEDALCKEDWQFLDCVEILSEYCPNCGARMDERREDECY